ncbi:MAG: hypothetical protein JWL62_3198 [Hyphomicrobiales bacterium]|nr:hypothetical protein [Hyphomicrobiales bacterium]
MSLPSLSVGRPAVFVGFDSAWTDNAKAPGPICSVLFEDGKFVSFGAPQLVGFERALDYIHFVSRPGVPTLVALDQPTIVPNEKGMRPVEKLAASLISWMGGGVQPANRSKLPMFGPHAPIWRFLEKLGAEETPEATRLATAGLHLMEVFPALALASLDDRFFGRLCGGLPSYLLNRRHTFRTEKSHSDAGWRFAVVAGIGFGLTWGAMLALVKWAGLPYLLAQILTTGVVVL